MSLKESLLFFLFVSFGSNDCYAQSMSWKISTKEEIASEFKKINEWYINNISYSIDITHNSYEDYKSKIPHETSKGIFVKNNTCYHSFLLGIYTLQNENYKVVIDSMNLILLLSNPDRSFNNLVNIQDYLDGLLVCKTIKKSEPSLSERRIRLEFSTRSPIEAFELVYFPEGNIKEMTTYYAGKVKKEGAKQEEIRKKPRLSLSFTNYNLNPKLTQDEFSEKKYLSVSKGKKPLLIGSYKKYKLSDQRIIVN